MIGVRYARIFWIGAAGVLVLAALIGISSLLRSDFTETDWQILLTLFALVVASGTAVAGLTVAERGHTAIGWGAVTVALVSFVFIGTSTWEGFDSETLGRLAGTAALALVATQAGAPATGLRVLASLDDVELGATRSGQGLAVELQPGERLVLRKRATG